ncbi:MAG: ShlB/FhaC/HecB family hemolysin secretion/activation protein [Rhodocyclales bacterium]|nr:ShlB/FhaC/HecB family hemolysin secretion/activation protein [Rhodocyclales bacterium]
MKPLSALRRNILLPTLCSSLLTPAGAWAQVAPDSGQILNELERSLPPAPPQRQRTQPLIDEPLRPPPSALASARFRVNGFRISRTQTYTEAELLPLVQEFVGRELSLSDVNRAADILTSHYRDRGHFVARAYVPAQDVKDGMVEIVVLEGSADKISVVPEGRVRLSGAYAQKVLENALGAGSVIRQENLERGLLLLDDTPGVDARAAIAPGATVGTSTVIANVTEGPLVGGSVILDNAGNKFSGTGRIGASLNLNDPSGAGDDATLRFIHSSGVDYGRIGYQVPIGGSGLKLGAAYAASKYVLCCDFAALQARGKASVATLTASYPFVRSRDYNLRGSLGYDARKYFDETVVATTSDRRTGVVTATLAADGRDGFGSGGQTSAALAFSRGNLHLSDWISDRNAALNAHTDGSYTKTAWNLLRLQRLGTNSSLYLALAGQFASKNLDSSEKFVLGGPQGVRAYPQGEATGDEGALLNLEFRYEFTPALRVAAFVDSGSIRVARNEWAPSAIPNRYTLSAAGFGLQWSQPGNFAVLMSLARRLGSNPGRNITGNDSDGTHDDTRFWLQAIKFF